MPQGPFFVQNNQPDCPRWTWRTRYALSERWANRLLPEHHSTILDASRLNGDWRS